MVRGDSGYLEFRTSRGICDHFFFPPPPPFGLKIPPPHPDIDRANGTGGIFPISFGFVAFRFQFANTLRLPEKRNLAGTSFHPGRIDVLMCDVRAVRQRGD